MDSDHKCLWGTTSLTLWRADLASPITRRQLAAHRNTVAVFYEKDRNNNLNGEDLANTNLHIIMDYISSRRMYHDLLGDCMANVRIAFADNFECTV